MKTVFHASLVNEPFEDPGLYVDVLWERRALLFDLGTNHRLSPRRLLKVSDVFVSHAHLDHFIGFDHLLRFRLARDRPLRLFGPPGITDRVAGKLSGYTWNLVEEYPFVLDTIELGDHAVSWTRMAAREAFRPSATRTETAGGEIRSIREEELFEVRATLLDHRIPCVAYAVQERKHVNVDRDALARRGLPVGSWLRGLKEKVRAGARDDSPVDVPGRGRLALGDLRDTVVSVSPGQKIAYVVDAAFHEENIRRILALARGADVLFCEAAFLERDTERARATGHLTARQAGWLAREVGARRLEVFHFSPRYEREPDSLRREAQEAFLGERA